MKQPRCRIAIKFEGGWATRCKLKPGHNGPHEARHLKELPYQKVTWFKGSDGEFETDRDREFGWRTRK